MATAKKLTIVPEQTLAESPEPTPEQSPAFDLEYLVAQRKQLDEAIRQARAAQPRQTPLEREITRQQEAGVRNGFVGPFYAKMLARRIALGQDHETALSEVAAL